MLYQPSPMPPTPTDSTDPHTPPSLPQRAASAGPRKSTGLKRKRLLPPRVKTGAMAALRRDLGARDPTKVSLRQILQQNHNTTVYVR